MIVEFLTFAVGVDDRAEWLEVEERTWSRFLETVPGFVRKEMWVDDARPDEVNAAIWWVDDASWSAVDADRCAAIDASMGPWFRPCTMRRFVVTREC